MRRAALAAALAVVVGGCGTQEPQEARERQAPPSPLESSEPEPSRATLPYRELRESCRRAASGELRVCEPGLWTIERCGPQELPDYDPCGERAEWTRATIERRVNGAWSEVAGHPRGSLHWNMVMGHWRNAWLSPDGSTILAQWSGECEVPVAFFVGETGDLRPVTGERDWTRSALSVAHGWSRDGRAHVSLLDGGCGYGHPEPGRYLVDPETHELEYLGPLGGRYAS